MWINTRGIRAHWHSSMCSEGTGRTADDHGLDTRYYMGAPRTLSCALDRCKTFPWIATTIERTAEHRELVYSVDQNSRALFRSVSLQFKYDYVFLAEVLRASYAAVSCFTLGYLSPKISVRHSVMPTAIWIWPRSIVSIELIICWSWDLSWHSWNYNVSADVCAGTASHA